MDLISLHAEVIKGHGVKYLEFLMRHAIGDFGDVDNLDKVVLTELDDKTEQSRLPKI